MTSKRLISAFAGMLVTGLVSFAVGQQPAAHLKFAPVPGGRLEFEDRGHGEAVLLIHGAVIADLLRPLAMEPALSGYRVIRLHRRGYAGSSPVGDSFSVAQDAADAAALLKYLRIARAHVVGHSSGGIVALELAAAHPEMVQSLTLLDPPLQFVVPHQLPPRIGGADSVEAFILAKGKPDLGTQLDAKLPGAMQQGRKDEHRFNVVEWAALGAWSFDDAHVRRVRAPVLYVTQHRTPMADSAQRWWPAMEFVERSEATHMFPFEEPAATAKTIAGFFKRQPK